jgi:TrmH family RNA methyltransferase
MRKRESITSPANPLLKEIRKAVARGTLTESGCCVAETFHLLEEALRSDCHIEAVLATESALPAVETALGSREDIRLIVLPDKLVDAATQGVVTLVEPPAAGLAASPDPLIVVLDGVQDPGNLGTIFRSAEAFRATSLMLLKGTVNPFHPKVIRASAGSIFRVPFVHGIEAGEAVPRLRRLGADQLYAAVPNAFNTLAQADLTRGCALIIGSEGQGVSHTMRSAAQDLTIPTAAVESLNAAISAAILLYEARRQRTLA